MSRRSSPNLGINESGGCRYKPWLGASEAITVAVSLLQILLNAYCFAAHSDDCLNETNMSDAAVTQTAQTLHVSASRGIRLFFL